MDQHVYRMRKGLWPLMEVLGHHAQTKVWDGDQISKTDRDALIYGGYLKRCGDGRTEITHAGLYAWHKLSPIWRFAQTLKRMKWRIREALNK